MRLLLASLVLLVSCLCSSASAQPASESRVVLLASGGDYLLKAPDGTIVASGPVAHWGFIEAGWWRGPGRYIFAIAYAGVHSEMAVLLDGSEYDFHVSQDMWGHLSPIVWREVPEVRARWVDATHIELRNDTDGELSVGTRSGAPFWEHRAAESGLTAAERADRTFHPTVECGSGFSSVLVPAHGAVELEMSPTSPIAPGDYHGAIRLYDPGPNPSRHLVATFEASVVEDGTRGGRVVRR